MIFIPSLVSSGLYIETNIVITEEGRNTYAGSSAEQQSIASGRGETINTQQTDAYREGSWLKRTVDIEMVGTSQIISEFLNYLSTKIMAPNYGAYFIWNLYV